MLAKVDVRFRGTGNLTGSSWLVDWLRRAFDRERRHAGSAS